MCLVIYAMLAPSVSQAQYDRLAQPVYFRDPADNLDSIKYFLSCIRDKDECNKAFKADSVLYDFYVATENNKHFDLRGKDNFTYIISLLSRARLIDKQGCLLPFIRQYDKDANDLYNYQDRIVAKALPYKPYVFQPSMKFIILFAVQFGLIHPLKLPDGKAFVYIGLERKDTVRTSYEFTRADWDEVYNLYERWFRRKYVEHQRVRRTPLSGSSYKWTVKTSSKRDFYNYQIYHDDHLHHDGEQF